MRLTKQQREVLKNKYGGRCAYCGTELKNGWHADHIEPIRRNIECEGCMFPNNDNFDNLNPSCPSCNRMKHSLNVEQFRDMIAYFIHSLNENINQYKFAKRYGLVKETNKEVKFYFEKIDTK